VAAERPAVTTWTGRPPPEAMGSVLLATERAELGNAACAGADGDMASWGMEGGRPIRPLTMRGLQASVLRMAAPVCGAVGGRPLDRALTACCAKVDAGM